MKAIGDSDGRSAGARARSRVAGSAADAKAH